ncbi:leucine-rich repeat domain-containing protein [Bacteroides sp.]|uniref:leucine-rich repeat domain-containing protein n=1 Tax=Bacteroides sp. TaxID=29523 RepID=UPI0026368A20|nr:leucine-rich repeat domain-containing protein [Bacteroides sp.]
MFTSIAGGAPQCQADDNVGSETESIDLFINHHSSSKELKAYMMMPPPLADQTGAATLTVTVSTQSGASYKGKLNLADYQILKAGFCHTLVPTLTLNPTITVPTITAGGLGNALNSIIPAAGQTELVLKSNGAINSNDHNNLKVFLQYSGTKITTLDLSGLNYPNETVVNLTGCTNLKEVILPVEATAIGDDAFSGCTSLAKVSQAEPATLTRASISSRMKTIGARAFKGTAIDVMYLHANITTIGDNAFTDCTALKALVFEGTKTVGTTAAADKIVIGADIISGTTPATLQVFLPNIKEANAAASSYQKKLSKDTHYNYTGTGDAGKLTVGNYTKLPDDPGATAPGLPGGTQLGDTPASGE